MKYKSIIGLSGGLDSSITAWLIGKEKPLALIVDNHWNTDIANRNIMRIINHFQLDYLWIKVDQEQFRDLQLAFIKSGISNIEIPTDHILYALVYKVADMVGAKVIYNGGNPQTEGNMPEEWGYNARDLKFIKAIHKRFGEKPMDKVPTLSLLGYLYYIFIKRIKIVQPLEDTDYNVKRAKELLKKEIGWEDYGDKHEESIYTKWFQQTYLPEKFGRDKRIPHYQALVNSWQMTEEEMQERLKTKPINKLEPFNIDWRNIPITTYKDYPNDSWVFNQTSPLMKLGRKIIKH